MAPNVGVGWDAAFRSPRVKKPVKDHSTPAGMKYFSWLKQTNPGKLKAIQAQAKRAQQESLANKLGGQMAYYDRIRSLRPQLEAIKYAPSYEAKVQAVKNLGLKQNSSDYLLFQKGSSLGKPKLSARKRIDPRLSALLSNSAKKITSLESCLAAIEAGRRSSSARGNPNRRIPRTLKQIAASKENFASPNRVKGDAAWQQHLYNYTPKRPRTKPSKRFG